MVRTGTRESLLSGRDCFNIPDTDFGSVNINVCVVVVNIGQEAGEGEEGGKNRGKFFKTEHSMQYSRFYLLLSTQPLEWYYGTNWNNNHIIQHCYKHCFYVVSQLLPSICCNRSASCLNIFVIS